MKTTRERLIEEIESFCLEQNMSPTTFGQLAKNDRDFVHGLRRGRNPNTRTIDAVYAFMDRDPGCLCGNEEGER